MTNSSCWSNSNTPSAHAHVLNYFSGSMAPRIQVSLLLPLKHFCSVVHRFGDIGHCVSKCLKGTCNMTLMLIVEGDFEQEQPQPTRFEAAVRAA